MGLEGQWGKRIILDTEALNKNIDPNPLTALFSLPPTQNMPTPKQRVIAFTTVSQTLHPS